MSSQLRDFIEELIANNKFRADCPVCFNKNTFSIKREGLETYYYCFHISCKLKGRIENDLQIDAIIDNNFLDISNNNKAIQPSLEQCSSFYRTNGACRDYLRSYNINVDDLELKYDPKEHRLVFPLKYKGENYGYVGRALAKHILPKWRTYFRRDGCPFILHRANSSDKRAILVEDCISVLRGVSVTNCVGLLGTSIPSQTLRYLLDFDKLYIALDPDAFLKSVELQKVLSYYRPTEILILKNDLKYYTDEALEKIRKEIE